jgi:subtilisin family serine protease
LTELEPVPIGPELPVLYSQFLNHLASSYGVTRVANWPLATIDVFCVVFEVGNPEERDAIVQALQREDGIETAQAVQSFGSLSDTYNDPYLSMQHGIHEIQAITSHQWSRGGGVRVAVIDTGMDHTHPDLESSTEKTRNFVDNNEIAFRGDAHGTAVAGLIAAEADNQTGMVGIAPDARLLAIKACWHESDAAAAARCNSLTLAKALNFAIQEQVDIINLSLTGPPDPLLERLVNSALAKDILVIGATPSHNNVAFPISIEGTVAVSMPDGSTRSISAPGRQVLSTHPYKEYDFFTGSSFSTAHITGLAALIRSLSPTLSPSDLLSVLENSSDTTSGTVNSCRAVSFALQMNAVENVEDVCVDQ